MGNYNPNVAAPNSFISKLAAAPRSVVVPNPDTRQRIMAMLSSAPVAPGILPPNSTNPTQVQGQPVVQPAAQPVVQPAAQVVPQTIDFYNNRLSQNEANVIQQQQREQAAALLRQQQAAFAAAQQQQIAAQQTNPMDASEYARRLRVAKLDNSQLPPELRGKFSMDYADIAKLLSSKGRPFRSTASPINNKIYATGHAPGPRPALSSEKLMALTKPRNAIS